MRNTPNPRTVDRRPSVKPLKLSAVWSHERWPRISLYRPADPESDYPRRRGAKHLILARVFGPVPSGVRDGNALVGFWATGDAQVEQLARAMGVRVCSARGVWLDHEAITQGSLRVLVAR